MEPTMDHTTWSALCQCMVFVPPSLRRRLSHGACREHQTTAATRHAWHVRPHAPCRNLPVPPQTVAAATHHEVAPCDMRQFTASSGDAQRGVCPRVPQLQSRGYRPLCCVLRTQICLGPLQSLHHRNAGTPRHGI